MPFRTGQFLLGLSCVVAFATSDAAAPQPPGEVGKFLEQHCLECHDSETQKGGLDLAALAFEFRNGKESDKWVRVHDLVRDGEMPPNKNPRPDAVEVTLFLSSLATPMIEAHQARVAAEGRSTFRRMNRFEYENTLRDLFQAPWLQIRDKLPEDGEAYRFNKIGDALDVSHIQMARYLGAADYALREVMSVAKPAAAPRVTRYYARADANLVNRMYFNPLNMTLERTMFPVLDSEGQPLVRAKKVPPTVRDKDPQIREKEGIGVVASSYEPVDLRFSLFKAPQSGLYRFRFNAYSVWVAPGPQPLWWRPNYDVISKGRRPEPVTVYGELPPRQLRLFGSFDVGVDPTVWRVETYLLKGEWVRLDAARLFRSRPPEETIRNPLAQPDGQPGLVTKWLDVEGPLMDEWPTPAQKLLFDTLPLVAETPDAPLKAVSSSSADAGRLLRHFMKRAYRHPFTEDDVQAFLKVIQSARQNGSDFTEAMMAGYTAVLCSPKFVCLEEKAGRLSHAAIASRLSYFLWNSEPDAELRDANLRDAGVLRQQTDRLLADARSFRFIRAFLDYWLDLRKAVATSPDATLYPEYYLDDLLVESALQETWLFFAELLQKNLPARNLIAADFTMLNERLAEHYGLPPVEGVALRRVLLPEGSVRGGLMTQASVLKVTANGTTTSPVVRGAWVMERLLGKPPPPPPSSVPAVEPDIRGARTIRQQIEMHRQVEPCASCHAKMDPVGFALENFDVMGGWRDRYRSLGEGTPRSGFGKNGQAFVYRDAQEVDASGRLPDGREFKDVRELKRILLEDETQIARGFLSQLIAYGTGAPVAFGDRLVVEEILKQAAADGFGVKSLVHAVVQSRLFQFK